VAANGRSRAEILKLKADIGSALASILFLMPMCNQLVANIPALD
jgi:hypothetical protein